MLYSYYSQIGNIFNMEAKAIFGAGFVLLVLKMVLDFVSRQTLIHRLYKLEQHIEKLTLSITTLIMRGTR